MQLNLQQGTLNRKRQIRFGPADAPRDQEVDLADGRGWDGGVTGFGFNFDISDVFALSNSFNFTRGDADTVGFVPAGGAVNVGALRAHRRIMDNPLPDPAPGAVFGPEDPLTGVIPRRLPDPMNPDAILGRPIDDSEYIQQFGTWLVQKQIESFTNNLALTGNFDNVAVTLGYYVARTQVDEQWSIGNQAYYTVRDGGELVDGIACNDPEDRTYDNCPGGFNYDLDANGDIYAQALYGALVYNFRDDFSVDFGVRQENHEMEYSADEGRDGVITKFADDYDESETSYTVGANWSITENQGVFGRISRGYRFPYFDDVRDNYAAFVQGSDLIREVQQYELGYKAGFDRLSAYLTLYANEVEGDVLVNRPGVDPEIFTSEAYGLEIDVRWYHESGFSVVVNGTIQETELSDTVLVVDGEQVTANNDGNEVQRQPGYQFRVAPSYDFTVAGVSASVYGSLTFVDDRYSDSGNTVELPGYEKYDLGFIVNLNQQLSLQLAWDNITDEDALTEGDPRNPDAPNGRFILPQSLKLSVAYNF